VGKALELGEEEEALDAEQVEAELQRAAAAAAEESSDASTAPAPHPPPPSQPLAQLSALFPGAPSPHLRWHVPA